MSNRAVLLTGLMVFSSLVVPCTAAAAVEAEACPEVAVVAARGSEQNDELTPMRYAPESRWESNGYEAENISGLITAASARHLEHTGEQLMTNVPVIGLDNSVYPAAMPLPELIQDGEDVDAAVFAQRASSVLSSRSPVEISSTAATAFDDSLRRGVSGTPGYLQAWEEATGCAPDYVLIGYSQGAMVLTAVEKQLAEQGRLRGVIYMGNPLLRPGDPSIVGKRVSSGGMAMALGDRWPRESGVSRRINYCLPRDIVCDLSPDTVAGQFGATGGTHPEYYAEDAEDPSAGLVADTFAGWVSSEDS